MRNRGLALDDGPKAIGAALATGPVALSGAHVPGVLRHLYRLTRWFSYRGRNVAYIHAYARPRISGSPKAIEFIVAQESGFEGIACVDDAARAALLALRVHEQTGHPAALRLAHDWLGFVAYMQEPDGRITNFILDQSGAKNRRGRTSRTGGAWWTARAMWAFAAGRRVTGEPRYWQRFRRCTLPPTRDLKIVSVQALALMEIYAVRPGAALQARICELTDAIALSGPRYFRDHAGRTPVAMWGYHQLQAVARAGRLFSRADYIAACRSTVEYLVEPALRDGFYHEYPQERNHQCAYDVSTLALGLEELYGATGDSRMRDLALRCARWFDGENPSGVPAYNPRTGRCADGVTDGKMSSHFGAESSIEAGFVQLMSRRPR